jgi:hypothetical protein
MKSRMMGSLIPVIVLTIPVLFAHTVLAGTGRQISASYSVVQKTDLGSRIRVAFTLKLVNHGNEALTVEAISFGSRHAAAGANRPVVLLAPLADETVALEFAVPKVQYERWRKDARRRLLFRINTPDGKACAELITMRRIPGGEGE